MPTRVADVATPLVGGLSFPECPRWRDGTLWFSDVWGHRVHTLGPDGTLATRARFEDRPAGLGFLPDGTPLVALMRSRRIVRLDADGTAHEHADLSGLPGDFVNDMLTCPDGRSLIGLRADDGDPEHLVLVEPDGTWRVAAEGLEGPNGTALLPALDRLVVCETQGGRLTTFARGADGTLTDRRTFADVRPATPDGLCVDAEGAAWVASPHSGEFFRVLEGGEVTARLRADEGVWPMACALGGPGGTTLFLLLARMPFDVPGGLDHLDRPDLDAARGARGWVYATEVEVPAGGWL